MEMPRMHHVMHCRGLDATPMALGYEACIGCTST